MKEEIPMMDCFYCKEQIDNEASVCKHCGARRYETRDSFDWYPPGETPDRHLFWTVAPILLIIAILIGGIWSNWKAGEDAERYVDCVITQATRWPGDTC